LKSGYDIDLRWRFFPLHPDTPQEGQSLADLFAGRGYDSDAIDAIAAQMKARMEAEGLEYNRRTHTYNSRLAQELAKWADSLGGYERIHDALYRAYFVEGRNIGDMEVLLDVARSVGLPEAEAKTVLGERLFREAVDEDWELARRYGITGVPTFVCEGRGVVGAQPYEVLERLVKKGDREGF
jgi:predicted DsbA family dithiol-disulfide isomerase